MLNPQSSLLPCSWAKLNLPALSLPGTGQEGWLQPGWAQMLRIQLQKQRLSQPQWWNWVGRGELPVDLDWRKNWLWWWCENTATWKSQHMFNSCRSTLMQRAGLLCLSSSPFNSTSLCSLSCPMSFPVSVPPLLLPLYPFFLSGKVFHSPILDCTGRLVGA